jgi:Fe-S-cluster containining protein
MSQTNLNEIEVAVNGSREDVAQYCLSKCTAKCCKKGKLLLTKDLANYVLNGKTDVLLFQRGENSIELDISRGCPSLGMDNKCLIHETSPAMCREFPVFLRYKTIILSEFCPAVNEPFFNKWVDIFLEKGIKVIRQ